MILTNEQVWCPVHGRMPLSEAAAYSDQVFFGWAPHYCKRCGSSVELVCNGDCGAGCAVESDGFCTWHGNYLGPSPFPAGVDEAKRRYRAAADARDARRRMETAECMGAEDEIIGPRRGIFG